MGRCPLAQLLAVPAARQRIQRGPSPLLVAAGPGGPRPGDQTPGRLLQGQAADQAFLLCAQGPAAAAQLAQGHLGFSLGFAEGDAAGFPPPKDLAVGHALGEVVEGDAAMAQSSWIDRPLKRATGKPRTEFQASWHGGAAGVYGRRTRQQRIARRSRLLPLNGQTSASPPPVRSRGSTEAPPPLRWDLAGCGCFRDLNRQRRSPGRCSPMAQP